MSNRLINENSPYLLQHAENPVNWYPWSTDALEKSRQEEKPIFLSIGYAACHWCHVMAHESFEDPETAAIMNASFINIKVDREERPDLDDIYMNAVVAMTGQGGWPMSVFLTPDGNPFYGGTYFPPTRKYNMPSFREVLNIVVKIWKDDRERLTQSGIEIKKHIQQQISTTDSSKLNESSLDQAAHRLIQSYDWDNGGWGKAPKFPQPMTIEFLLRRASRGDKMSLDICNHVLKAMAKGGLYDVIGGGFARYSTDDTWLVPHFEKMLYDNAQLARVYLHAYLITKDQFYRRICESTLEFIAREMMSPAKNSSFQHGGFYSSLDADSEGVEGKFYIWSYNEIKNAFSYHQDSGNSQANDIDIFLAAYGITEDGNFEGKMVLQRILDNKTLAENFNLSVDVVDRVMSSLHDILLLERDKRIRPSTDDKVLTSWNTLTLDAFSEAARYLGRSDYLEISRNNAEFILNNLYIDRRLYRSWRNGSAKHDAYLEDYSGLILGLLSLYQSDPAPFWFKSAYDLADDLVKNYKDEKAGFFDTRDDHEKLIFRPKRLQDNATPSGNAMAALAFLRVFGYTGKSTWHDLVVEIVGLVVDEVLKYPLRYSKWLCAFDSLIYSNQEIAILGNPDDTRTKGLIDTVWTQFDPNRLVAISDYPPVSGSPDLLNNRSLLNGAPTAYVCENFVCNLPVSTPKHLKEQLL